MNQSGSFVNKAGHEIEITDENLESLMEEEGFADFFSNEFSEFINQHHEIIVKMFADLNRIKITTKKEFETFSNNSTGEFLFHILFIVIDRMMKKDDQKDLEAA